MRAAVVLVAALATAAWGHGVEPQVTSFTASSDGALRVAGATFGALLNWPPAETFGWVCEEAVGLKETDRPVYLVTGARTLFAAALSGLYVSRDLGCTWTAHPTFAGSGASDIARVGRTLFVTTGRFGVENALWASVDDGVTFTRSTLTSTSEFYSAVRVAPSRPERVYVSAWYYEPPSNALLFSDDSGASFFRIPLTTKLPATGPFRVLAVDPGNPDVVIASVCNDAVNQKCWLLRSDDTGHSFTALSSVEGEVGSAAFRSGTLWVAAGERLHSFTARDGGTWDEQTLGSPSAQACAMGIDGEVYTCGDNTEDGFALARLKNGLPTSVVLSWDKLSGPIECPEASPAAQFCNPIWNVQRFELGLPIEDGPAPVSDTLGKVSPVRCGIGEGSFVLAGIAIVGLRRRQRRIPADPQCN